MTDLWGPWVLAQLEVNPNPGVFPGGPTIQRFLDGVAWWGIMAAGIAFVAYGALLAIASRAGNHRYTFSAKRGLLAAAVGALLIGGAATIINWAVGVGQGIQGAGG